MRVMLGAEATQARAGSGARTTPAAEAFIRTWSQSKHTGTLHKARVTQLGHSGPPTAQQALTGVCKPIQNHIHKTKNMPRTRCKASLQGPSERGQ